MLNIGGICNGTYLKDENIIHSSDIGPGNCLLDATMRNFNLGKFDLDGALASKGNVDSFLLEELLSQIEAKYRVADADLMTEMEEMEGTEAIASRLWT